MGKGRSRSLNMTPFDKSYTNYYWSAIVSALCCTIFELFDVTLKSRLRVNSMSLKMVPLESYEI